MKSISHWSFIVVLLLLVVFYVLSIGLIMLVGGGLGVLIGVVSAILIGAFVTNSFMPFSFLQSLMYLLQRSLKWESLLVILFMMFLVVIPRLASVNRSQYGRIGFSPQIEANEIQKLAADSGVAFRVFFKNREEYDRLSSHMYWRGAVLEKNQGLSWTRNLKVELIKPAAKNHAQTSEVLNYEVMLEPSSTSQFAFVLDFPGEVSALDEEVRLELTENNEFMIHRAGVRRPSYLVSSFIDKSFENFRSDIGHSKLQNQAAGSEDPRYLQFLTSIEKNHYGSLRETLTHLEEYFKKNKFVYQLELPRKIASIQQFLFEDRAGVCEHYASVTAKILRDLGYEVRTVVGYQGGIWNSLGGFLEVRTRDAHAWVEVYDRTTFHWMRVDPTSWVAAVAQRQAQWGSLYDRQTSNSKLLSSFNSVLVVGLQRIGQQVNSQLLRDSVQKLFDLSDSMQTKSSWSYFYLVLTAICVGVYFYLRNYFVKPRVLRKLDRIQRKMTSVNQDLVRKDTEGLLEWIDRCYLTNPTLPPQYRTELRSIAQEVYDGVSR